MDKIVVDDEPSRGRSSNGGVVQVTRQTPTLLGWPSDAFSVDWTRSNTTNNNNEQQQQQQQQPHTLLVFVPGNPGLIEWYIPLFEALVRRLGPSYAARGVANAGHSIDPDRVHVAARAAAAAASPLDTTIQPDTSIPWTVDGQAWHKVAYLDWVLTKQFPNTSPKLVFIAHSIGMHFTHRVLLFRPDLAARTLLQIALMPFIRMDAPTTAQMALNWAAAHPAVLIGTYEKAMGLLRQLPFHWVEHLLRKNMTDVQGRRVAAALIRQPKFARNFFTLGTEEIRDVPETVDVAALRHFSFTTKTAMLFAGNDQWAPVHHLDDLRPYAKQFCLSLEYNPQLKHDFVSDTQQVPPVIEFCLRHILAQASRQQHGGGDDDDDDDSNNEAAVPLRSRL